MNVKPQSINTTRVVPYNNFKTRSYDLTPSGVYTYGRDMMLMVMLMTWRIICWSKVDSYRTQLNLGMSSLFNTRIQIVLKYTRIIDDCIQFNAHKKIKKTYMGQQRGK